MGVGEVAWAEPVASAPSCSRTLLAARFQCEATAVDKGQAADAECVNVCPIGDIGCENACAVFGDLPTIESMVDSTVTQILARVPTTPTTTLSPDPCLSGDCSSCFLCVQSDDGARRAWQAGG
jgi:hypothetical protein